MVRLQTAKRVLNKSRKNFGLRRKDLEDAGDLRSYIALLELRYKMQFTTVFDIGAHTGTWSTSLAGAFFDQPRFILFEPNISHKPELEATGYLI
jgi:hypothetical protein